MNKLCLGVLIWASTAELLANEPRLPDCVVSAEVTQVVGFSGSYIAPQAKSRLLGFDETGVIRFSNDAYVGLATGPIERTLIRRRQSGWGSVRGIEWEARDEESRRSIRVGLRVDSKDRSRGVMWILLEDDRGIAFVAHLNARLEPAQLTKLDRPIPRLPRDGLSPIIPASE